MDVWPPGFSYPDPSALPLVFVPVPEPKTGKNRVHLDLATESVRHQAAEVKRLLALGAVPADIGQGDVPWTVLADPEGNEFCVLDPRPVYRDTGPVAAVVADCADPAAVAGFWALATGWAPASSTASGSVVAVTGWARAVPGAAAVGGREDRQEPDPPGRGAVPGRGSRGRGPGADRGGRRLGSISARATCRGPCWPTPRAASSASLSPR